MRRCLRLGPAALLQPVPARGGRGLNLWIPVFVQGAIVAHLVFLTLRSPARPGPWPTLLACVALAASTSLAWAASELIADAFPVGAKVIPDRVVGIHGFWHERRRPSGAGGGGGRPAGSATPRRRR